MYQLLDVIGPEHCAYTSAPLHDFEHPANAAYRPQPQPTQSTAPLVLVEGFLSYTSEFFWGDFETHLNAHRVKIGSKKRRHIIFARVGPVNSLHDRACELYYVLKGGTVDYGETHASESGHNRYGRHHGVGLYPSWSAENPLHFLGHSMGGVTIQKMISLICEGFFGPCAHPDMVLSITAVTSPFRGSQIAYSLSRNPQISPSFGYLSFSSFLSKSLHLVSYVAPFLPSWLIPDLHTESRALSCYDISFRELLRQLWKSEWSEGKDATPWDCTFEAAEEREAKSEKHEMGQRTWYRSYVSCMTERNDPIRPYHTPHPSRFLSATMLFFPSIVIGNYDFSVLRPVPSFFSPRQLSSRAQTPDFLEGGDKLTPESLDLDNGLGEEFFANDGVVPVFSQWHPGPCGSSRCIHHPELSPNAAILVPPSEGDAHPRPKAGIWNVYHIPDTHHLSLMPLWMGTEKQISFWYGLGEWLEEVDGARVDY